MQPHFDKFLTHESGIRDRTITNWRLIPTILNQFYLVGQVLTEYGQALSHIRITETSPIKYREGDVMITTSGSRYKLLDPHPYTKAKSYLIISEKK